MQTKEGFAALLSGREYRSEITKTEVAEAKASGLVVMYGYSDDGVHLSGAINDEVGAWDGTTIRMTPHGALEDWESLDRDDEDVAEDYFRKKAGGFREIRALWSSEPNYSWTFSTEIPHATFEVVEDGEPYCRGIVFALADVLAGASA
jgi:hypothetical protein